MELFLGILPILLLVFACIIGRRTLKARIARYRPDTEKALKEYRAITTPPHYFSEEDERLFRYRYEALSATVDKKIVHALFKRNWAEVSVFSDLVRCFRHLSEDRRENNRIVRAVENINSTLPIAIEEYNYLFSGRRYLAEHETVSFISRWKTLSQDIRSAVKEGWRSFLSPSWKQFQDNYSSARKDKDKLNRQFITSELSEREDYFDHLLKYPLDPQQREAIITMEENCLVVSSAGSGKTSTIEGRVHYLVDTLKVDPRKILLVTYTNKAASSLTERLGIDGLKCYTFHKLARDIIARETGMAPSFADEDLKKTAYDALIQDNEFLGPVNDYFNNYQSAIDEFDFETKEEYFRAMENGDNRALFPDMHGNTIYTRSGQEKRICYYLSVNGVEFLYENPYEFQTADQQHRQYKPDFTIEFTDEQGIRRRLYYEHFGIDRNGHVPRWFGDNVEGGWEAADARYNEGILWKRETHRNNHTALMETTSADFDGNNFEQILLDKLRANGVPIRPKSPREIYEQITADGKGAEKEFLRMLESFLSLMKSSCRSIDEINTDSVSDRKLKRRFDFILEKIVRPYCIKYEALLAERGEIDFTDAIIKATEYSNASHECAYEHIIVDEFQDISLDRYRFIQSLRRKSPFTYLFCVGDDWQSIYRFAGSDMALFKNFEKFFGFTKRCPIETTYRFGEPLIGKASRFITANPVQTVKHVRPVSEDRFSDVKFYSYPENGMGSVAAGIIDGIPDGESVLLLGRYGFSAKDLASDRRFRVKLDDGKGEVTYNGRKLQFLSVHKAKGLEADHVILLGCDSGFYGFPSNIADDPVLRLVLSEDDQYEYGEERRLFYVAMTRCRKMTYILYCDSFPSPFVREFIPGIPEEERCPLCRSGRKLVRMHGIARNGHPYVMYGCSNYRLGCDYQEFVFDNETVLPAQPQYIAPPPQDDDFVPMDEEPWI